MSKNRVGGNQFQNQNDRNVAEAAATENTLKTGPFLTDFCQAFIGGTGHAVPAAGSTGPVEMETGSNIEIAPAASRFRVGTITNMPAPIAGVDRLRRIDFKSEELRTALLAGGEPAQHVTCPKCESDNVRRSSPARFYESYLRFFMSPYRCRKCLSRFYRPISCFK